MERGGIGLITVAFRVVGVQPRLRGYPRALYESSMDDSNNDHFNVLYKRYWYIPLIIMARVSPTMFDPQVKQLADLGTRLRLARLRRKYTAATVAARAGITRVTLGKIERGIPGTSLGAYLSVLRALGLQADINAIARDDEMGRRLQDLELPEPRSRAPKTITARDSAPPLKPDLREGAP